MCARYTARTRCITQVQQPYARITHATTTALMYGGGGDDDPSDPRASRPSVRQTLSSAGNQLGTSDMLVDIDFPFTLPPPPPSHASADPHAAPSVCPPPLSPPTARTSYTMYVHTQRPPRRFHKTIIILDRYKPEFRPWRRGVRPTPASIRIVFDIADSEQSMVST